ncbi:putative transmembrane protein [Gregarina niphandrodes]|uniref:Transmembrane protein n=1 Tax=Gregarina niphandrodes TaxID=110365 RepID=A0A023BB87_GRENI|nr:putative transmembrane protein [Gregarina niphandrodes]EZG79346.1 putative transmembrane protein [Gregarina niphandrodes]|eukprot:XP_011129066.1 putative transmembrane protein [Gregarina niphandrodes]
MTVIEEVPTTQEDPATQEDPEPGDSMWTILSDAIDECIGVKGRPDRLVNYSYFFFLCLTVSICLVWSVIPDSATLAPGESKPGLSQLTLSLNQDAFLNNGYVLKHNTWIIKLLVGLFAACIVALVFLITHIGSALTNDLKTKKEK